MEGPQLLTRLEQVPTPGDDPQPFFLIDRMRKEAIACLIVRPSTIKLLNKPQWMKSRGWIYVPENDHVYSYEISKFLR